MPLLLDLNLEYLENYQYLEERIAQRFLGEKPAVNFVGFNDFAIFLPKKLIKFGVKAWISFREIFKNLNI